MPFTAGSKLALLDHPKLTAADSALGDEHAAVGQKRDAPWRVEVLGHDFHTHRLLLAFHHRAVQSDDERGARSQDAALRSHVLRELPDLFVTQALERRHGGIRDAIANRVGNSLVGRRCEPLLIEQAGRAAAGQVRAVTA